MAVLEKNAEDIKSGAGGFILVANDYIFENNNLDRDRVKFQINEALSGIEILELREYWQDESHYFTP